VIKYIIIFIALLITDVIWAFYIRWSASGKAFRAAVMSILIYVIGAFTFAEFIKDQWVLIPAGLGCFIGTYVTIKYLDNNKKKLKKPEEWDMYDTT
jgi:hypothetical protein